MDIDKTKDRSNLGKLWGRHRKNPAMIKEAKEMVAVDKAEAEEAAAAAAAAPAPAPQVSNNNAALEEATKATLAAATNANRGLDKLAVIVQNLTGTVHNLVGTVETVSRNVQDLAGTVGDLAGTVREQGN